MPRELIDTAFVLEDITRNSSVHAAGVVIGDRPLTEYLPPQRLAAVLGDVGVSTVFGRVPLPGRQTEIVKIPALRVPDHAQPSNTMFSIEVERYQ